ncbi:hypothetical protein TSAR_011905, partial [Trichomalopsis sarcophagae]
MGYGLSPDSTTNRTFEDYSPEDVRELWKEDTFSTGILTFKDSKLSLPYPKAKALQKQSNHAPTWFTKAVPIKFIRGNALPIVETFLEKKCPGQQCYTHNSVESVRMDVYVYVYRNIYGTTTSISIKLDMHIYFWILNSGKNKDKITYFSSFGNQDRPLKIKKIRTFPSMLSIWMTNSITNSGDDTPAIFSAVFVITDHREKRWVELLIPNFFHGLRGPRSSVILHRGFEGFSEVLKCMKEMRNGSASSFTIWESVIEVQFSLSRAREALRFLLPCAFIPMHNSVPEHARHKLYNNDSTRARNIE